MAEEELRERAEAYAFGHGLALGATLGYGGVHGSVWVVRRKGKVSRWAMKVYREPEPYERERDCYRRLRARKVTELLGFNVPQVLRTDDGSLVVEMSIVKPPFVLDFAGAYLGSAPDFTPEIWEEWETAKKEQFEEHWPKVKRVLAALDALGIKMIDVHPGNVRIVG